MDANERALIGITWFKGQTPAIMAEYDDGGVVDMSYGDSIGLGGAGRGSSDEEYETMTAAEVLEKLEEV